MSLKKFFFFLIGKEPVSEGGARSGPCSTEWPEEGRCFSSPPDAYSLCNTAGTCSLGRVREQLGSILCAGNTWALRSTLWDVRILEATQDFPDANLKA